MTAPNQDMAILTQLVNVETEYRRIIGMAQSVAPDIFLGLRRQHNWTQADMAAFLDCDPTYISRIERGHMQAGIPILMTLYQRLQEARLQ